LNRTQKRRQKKLSKSAVAPNKPELSSAQSGDQKTSNVQQSLDRAIQHHRAGQLPEAERIYQQILHANPKHPIALHLLGVIAINMGKNDVAVDLISQALTTMPHHADAHYDIGIAFLKLGKLEDAVASFLKALAIKPDNAMAYTNLGIALQDMGKPDQAVSNFHKALAIVPDHAKAHNNLGIALQDLGKLDEGVASFYKALAIKPDYFQAHYNLGTAFIQIGKLDEAIVCYREALSIKPDYAEAHNNIGIAFKKMLKLEKSVASFHQALAIKPDYPEAHYNLGTAFQELNKLDEAIECYREALSIKPDFTEARYNLSFQLRWACAWSEADRIEAEAEEYGKGSIGQEGYVSPSPLSNIATRADVSENFAVARAKSDEIAKIVSGQNGAFQVSHRKSRKSKITIGYLSNDFYDHATSHLMLGLFGLHDRQNFNIFTFSYGRNDKSEYREQIKSNSDKFVDIQTFSHLEAANEIFACSVDILVDLKGHTQGNRLEICALRPAPVQATYLGFPGTSGAEFLDYIITDRIVTPEDQSAFYSEQLVYLPHSYQVNDQNQKISNTTFSRSDFNLPERAFVFCSFTNNYKIDPDMFGIWMNLLKDNQDSVLWLLRSNGMVEQNLRSEAEARGVSGDRLIFAEKMPKDQHLARCQLANLALDTRIYNGHTTTSDILWAGVPVVSMRGTHFASRVSASLLNAIGLPELVTNNLEEYEALASRLCQNPDTLDGLKTKLSGNRLTEPLFDTPRFTRNLESAYRSMWDRYLAGGSPSRIDVVES
jgi:protein O-GlcNAc transferase